MAKPKQISTPKAMYYGDNLDVLRRDISTESVDLIHLDPPFNSNTSYNVLSKTKSGTAAQAKADMGVLITMETKSPAMIDAANHSGTFHDTAHGKTYPVVQIITVEELLAGKGRAFRRSSCRTSRPSATPSTTAR